MRVHEMSIALAVVEQVEQRATHQEIGTVRSVRLRMGELCGVVPDALEFCFAQACAGTVLEGARLLTESVAARARCEPCAGEWAVGMPPDLCCPTCGAPAAGLLSGCEMQIAAVEWDHAAPAGVGCAPGTEER